MPKRKLDHDIKEPSINYHTKPTKYHQSSKTQHFKTTTPKKKASKKWKFKPMMELLDDECFYLENLGHIYSPNHLNN